MIKYCHDCDKYIDLDEDVEHFEMHEEEKKKKAIKALNKLNKSIVGFYCRTPYK